jgi:hypothetical protein
LRADLEKIPMDPHPSAYEENDSNDSNDSTNHRCLDDLGLLSVECYIVINVCTVLMTPEVSVGLLVEL